MARIMFVLLALLTVAACATRQGYLEVMQSWIGATEDALVDAWGFPDSTYEKDGKRFLIYDSARTATYSDPAPLIFYKATPTGGEPETYAHTNLDRIRSVRTVTYWCYTVFRVERDIVVNGTARGNSCRA